MSSRLLIVDRGELGWTLCGLLPRARVIASHYRDVTVATPAGREYLWHGIAHTIRAVHSVAGSQEFLSGRFEQRDEQHVKEWATGRHVWPSPQIAGSIVRDERAGFREPRFVPSLEKQWGDLLPNPYRAAEILRALPHRPDVCFAVRPPKLLHGRTLACKSWPPGCVGELVDLLAREGVCAAFVGGSDNLYADGALDLRGVPLETLCAVLGAARVTVGPSSGPLHLSQLCLTPVVTWYGVDAARESSRNRYQGSWNPYRVPCTYLDDACPTAADVMSAVVEYAR